MTVVDEPRRVLTDVSTASRDAFTSRDFRTVMGCFATGVTVMTVATDVPHGMTANAFASVSKEPPLVLICVDRDATMHQRVLDAGTFAVSVLSGSQTPLARYFANRLRPHGFAQFAGVRWAPGRHTRAPLLDGAVAWLECELSDAYVAGDHSIFVGTVLDLARCPDIDALLFYRGDFHQIGGGTPPEEPGGGR